eukprot:3712132-Pleurochrysis_carterae.AAC.2
MATAAARLACTAVAGSQGVEAADPWRTHTAYARIGLVGNPSDGFFGKTIAVAVSNWKASVRIRPSPRIVLEPHPVCDPHAFDSMEELHRAYSKQGYQGVCRTLFVRKSACSCGWYAAHGTISTDTEQVHMLAKPKSGGSCKQ